MLAYGESLLHATTLLFETLMLNAAALSKF
jgi:hypothetical protein